MTLKPLANVKYTYYLSYSSLLELIFHFLIKATKKVSAHIYDIEIKGHCQIYILSIVQLETRTPLSFSDTGGSIAHGVLITMKVSVHHILFKYYTYYVSYSSLLELIFHFLIKVVHIQHND